MIATFYLNEPDLYLRVWPKLSVCIHTHSWQNSKVFVWFLLYLSISNYIYSVFTASNHFGVQVFFYIQKTSHFPTSAHNFINFFNSASNKTIKHGPWDIYEKIDMHVFLEIYASQVLHYIFVCITMLLLTKSSKFF
jgi:hypothetical protein